MKEAFAIYKDIYLTSLRHQKNDDNSQDLIHRFKKRQLRTIFDAMLAFQHTQRKVKGTLGRVFNRMLMSE